VRPLANDGLRRRRIPLEVGAGRDHDLTNRPVALRTRRGRQALGASPGARDRWPWDTWLSPKRRWRRRSAPRAWAISPVGSMVILEDQHGDGDSKLMITASRCHRTPLGWILPLGVSLVVTSCGGPPAPPKLDADVKVPAKPASAASKAKARTRSPGQSLAEGGGDTFHERRAARLKAQKEKEAGQ
jgi:hypothetical protein